MTRPWVPGTAGFLHRLRDLVERGRLDVAQLRLADIMSWVLRRADADAGLSDLCGALEAAARLALLKVRSLDDIWQLTTDDDAEPWLGPPPELPIRRSWLGERIATGPLSFVAAARTFEAGRPSLAPVAPARLHAMMLSVLGRQKRPAPVAAEHRVPRVSTEVCSALIIERLHEEGEIRLRGIAGDSRDAHVAAFLSCLILARQGHISLEQDEPFGDVVIRPALAALDVTA